MSTASDVTSRAFPKQSFNQLVAIASYITYNRHRNTCIPVLATKILSTLASIVATSREPGNLFGIGGLNAINSGTTTETTQDGSLNNCHTSLIAFFDNEKYAFSKSIVDGLRESGIMMEDGSGASSSKIVAQSNCRVRSYLSYAFVLTNNLQWQGCCYPNLRQLNHCKEY